MKTKIFIAAVLCLLFSASSYAQILTDEVRPFDFSDKYYEDNGVVPSMLIGRHNGADNESVIDYTPDTKYSNVRILATFPGYDTFGQTIFWNYYAGVSKAGFTENNNGGDAVSTAFEYPLYVFPSTTVKNSYRQSALIRIDESYWTKNPLGISAVYLVEYTDRIMTKTGRASLDLLMQRNGVSVDGTPIIRTAKEIDYLLEEGLITLTQPFADEVYQTPFAIAKIIRNPDQGGITKDSFLKYVVKQDGNPLDSEAHFLMTFECHKNGEKCF